MLIWILLFLIVVGISAVLAFSSMRDWQERPQDFGLTYTLYLIQKPENLTAGLIDKLYQAAAGSRAIISFERLLKGSRSALVVFGPAAMLRPYIATFNLLELEDYSKKELEDARVWEMGLKDPVATLKMKASWFKEAPELLSDEQFWWQMVVQPKPVKAGSRFLAEIRAVLIASDNKRTEELEKKFSRIGSEIGLSMLPQAYSASQMLNFYQARSIPKGHLIKPGLKEVPIIISSEELLSLLGF